MCLDCLSLCKLSCNSNPLFWSEEGTWLLLFRAMTHPSSSPILPTHPVLLFPSLLPPPAHPPWIFLPSTLSLLRSLPLYQYTCLGLSFPLNILLYFAQASSHFLFFSAKYLKWVIQIYSVYLLTTWTDLITLPKYLHCGHHWWPYLVDIILAPSILVPLQHLVLWTPPSLLKLLLSFVTTPPLFAASPTAFPGLFFSQPLSSP